MSALAFTTRDQAAVPERLVQLMSGAFYEAGRPQGSSRPAWPDCGEEWRTAVAQEMRTALKAALAAGYRIESP